MSVINARSKCEAILRVNSVIPLTLCNILFCFVDGLITTYCGAYLEFFIIVITTSLCWLSMATSRQLRPFSFGFKLACLLKSIFTTSTCPLVDAIRSAVLPVLSWWSMLAFFSRNSWIMLPVPVFAASRRGVESLTSTLSTCAPMRKRVKQIFLKQKMDIIRSVCLMAMVVFKNNRNKEMLL